MMDHMGGMGWMGRMGLLWLLAQPNAAGGGDADRHGAAANKVR